MVRLSMTPFAFVVLLGLASLLQAPKSYLPEPAGLHLGCPITAS